ncbi:MAG: CBS domain-containing protein [Desulfovibrionaceae bacterium]|jgi:acetoin utilization protein AcuB|nr:CBS domain-containing protein [Desulfovibrionaceae bacterium]
MLIKNWMTHEVITVTPETSMMKASKLMKEHKINRLPVVDEEGHVVGIVSDRDLKEASPSKATTLDVHELYYLLAEIKIRDIMTPNPLTVREMESVEKVAVMMIENGIGGLPVVDADNRIVGIITDHDIFKVLVEITGVRYGGLQFAFEIPNVEGTLKPILDDLRDFGTRIVSVLTSMGGADAPTRTVNIRILPMDRAEENKIIEALKDRYKLLFWARDNVHPIL